MTEVDQYKGAHDAIQAKLTIMSHEFFCLGSMFLLQCDASANCLIVGRKNDAEKRAFKAEEDLAALRVVFGVKGERTSGLFG